RAVQVAPRPVKHAIMLALGGAAVVGGVIFWNTNIRNSYASSARIERQRVAYERAFGSFVTQPQPRIAALDLALDLYPAERAFTVKGEMPLRNPTPEPIARFYVESQSANLNLSVPEASTVAVPRPECCRVFEVSLKTPLPPGQEMKLTFEDRQRARGQLNGDE